MLGIAAHPAHTFTRDAGMKTVSALKSDRISWTNLRRVPQRPEIVDNLVVFTQMLMQKYNVPLENVVRHYDVTGKWCPRPWMGDDRNTYYGTSGNEQWKKFKERLSGEELDMNIEEARKQLTSCADTGDTPSEWARDAAEFCKRKGIFNGDGAGNYGWQQPITREAVAQILYNAFESAGMLDAIPDKK